jgi:uncharacterized protein YqgV (UPF0045/DUF77 family)
METTMEGELDHLLEIVKQAHNICVNEGADRVLSVIKIDYKPEGVTMDEKDLLENKLDAKEAFTNEFLPK